MCSISFIFHPRCGRWHVDARGEHVTDGGAWVRFQPATILLRRLVVHGGTREGVKLPSPDATAVDELCYLLLILSYE